MSLWRNAAARVAKILNQVISTSEDLDRYLRDGLSNRSSTGISVTADTAMQSAAVYACVRVLAESVAQLPIRVYRRSADGSKERAPEHPLHRLLHDRPNAWQTSFEWREMMQSHLALRGNAYSFKNRVRGDVRELLPIHPDRVTVEQDERWRLSYNIAMPEGRIETFGPDRILHLRGLSSNGFTGLSPISMARESIGLALATEKHGALLFGNGTRIGGVLQHPGRLSEQAARNLKESKEATYSGLEKAHGLMVLEEGMSFQPVMMTAEDAQFLETRAFQLNEIARIFRIPPHMIGDLTRSTNNNIEHQSLEFVKYTLAPWLARWEQALTVSLLSEADQQVYFVEFVVDGLLRGDFKARVEGYASALQNGWMSVNDVRGLENMNPVEGGDKYFRQLNLTPLDGPDFPLQDNPANASQP